mgnify:CR=1 FL=1
MTRKITSRVSRVSRTAALLAACALAASLASCGRSDPVQEEIDRVSTGLGAISTSGSTALQAVDHRRTVYQWVIDRMSGRASARDPIASDIARPAGARGPDDPGRPATQVADAAAPGTAPIQSSNPGQAAAANLLLARGYAGLGEISAQEAARLEAGASLQISPIRAALDQWLSQNAAADALAAYDPASDIAQIEKQIGEKQKLADDARAGKDRQLTVISGIEKQAAELTDRSKAMRQQEAQVRGRATSVSETARLELITEATRIRREADQVEKEAANLLARVALEQPKADTQQRGIDELTTQIQLLRTDKDNLRQRADQRAAAAKRARDEAQTAATRLAQMLASLDTVRESLNGPTDAALGAYEKAVGAARKAGQGSRDAKAHSAMTAGNYQHAMADTLATRVRGQAAYADLIGTLARATPALPGAAELATRAAAATAAAEASRTAAAEALLAARDHYTSASASGDTKDRLEALEVAMNALLGTQPAPTEGAAPAPDAPDGGTPTAEAPPAADAGAMAAAGASGDLGAVEAEVRTTLEQIAGASKASDFDALREYLYIADESARPALDQLLDILAGPAGLNAACIAAYAKPLQQVIDESSVQSIKTHPVLAMMKQAMGSMSITPAGLDASGVAGLPVTPVSATEALVAFPAPADGGAAQTVKFTKAGGDWKIDLSGQLAGFAAMAPMLGPMKAVGEAFTKVSQRLTAAEYADADAMLIGLNKELTIAMQKMSGLRGPGGGPGGGGG